MADLTTLSGSRSGLIRITIFHQPERFSWLAYLVFAGEPAKRQGGYIPPTSWPNRIIAFGILIEMIGY